MTRMFSLRKQISLTVTRKKANSMKEINDIERFNFPINFPFSSWTDDDK